MLSFLTTRIGRALAAAGAVVMAVLGVFIAGRREGRQAAKTDALEDSAKRQERGRDAVQDLRNSDTDDLVDQLHDNDAKW